MTVEAAVRESLAAAPGACVVAAGAGRAGEAVDRVRAAQADFVLLLIESDMAPLDRAMAIAAIGPLAVELAPGRRIAALDVTAGAAPADTASAALFLAAARSTTGQVLTVGTEA